MSRTPYDPVEDAAGSLRSIDATLGAILEVLTAMKPDGRLRALVEDLVKPGNVHVDEGMVVASVPWYQIVVIRDELNR
jgi:hypothetical protein